MKENQLAQNILYYRKQRGLSQERVAEYLNVSRQAVAKWENNISRPSSDNLILLAELFEVSVEVLLGNKDQEDLLKQTNMSMEKGPWILIGISALCIVAYIIKCSIWGHLSIGTLVCMFVICVPLQLFLHIYFSYAINTDSFNGIAGYNDKIEYNVYKVKQMLAQIDLHIGIESTLCVFMLFIINYTDLEFDWINGFCLIIYLMNFIATVLIINFKMIDEIYCYEDDKMRAKRSLSITVIYLLLLLVGIGLTSIIFEVREIQNNTLPAMKISSLLILGIIIVTIGFVLESHKIKQWKPKNQIYRTSKFSIISLLVCGIIYVYRMKLVFNSKTI